jgi:aryl-alcohol dehydrogenase-like predicted oxidoreductase
MRLALGTVQFGLDYGVSNKKGKCPPAEAARIIEMAAQAGVTIIDTAPTYGDSEKVLGDILPADHNFQIVCKTPSFGDCTSADDAADLVERTLEASLSRMRVSHARAVLVHHAGELDSELGKAVFTRLTAMRDENIIGMIGVSVYTPVQIDHLVSEFAIQCVQAPINILDQRMVVGGQFKRLKNDGIEIHGRSIFLQGLLLMGLSDLPAHYAPLRSHLARYHNGRIKAGLTTVEAAVAFIAHLDEIDYTVVGVTSATEFEQIAAAAKANHSGALDWHSFAASDDSLLDPSQWPSTQMAS